MISFYLCLIGAYLYYCQSKYFPAWLFKVNTRWSSWLGLALFSMATGLFVRVHNWASGLLLALVALSVALMLIQFVAVLGRAYIYSLIVIAHSLLLFDLLA